MKKAILYFAMAFFLLSGCSKPGEKLQVKTLQDLENKRIIVASGSTQEAFIMMNLPKAEVIRVQNLSDMFVALKSKKGDVLITEYIGSKSYQDKNGGIDIPVDSLFGTPIGVAFPKKNAELRDRFNLFLDKIIADGTLQDIKKRWLGDDAKKTIMPVIKNKGGNGTILFGCSGTEFPFSFIQGGKYAGLDVEIAERFAAEVGMKLDVKILTFASLITAISSSKIDMAANCISITEERAKKIAFSEPYMWSKSSVSVLSEEKNKGGSFISSLKNDIYKTFVQDDRYKLLLKGIWCTIKISLFSILLGTILGFLICWMRMSSVKWLVKFTKAYIYFFRGIPQVVFLMLLFYVVFASSKLSGEVVSIIGFGITFSAYVCEMFRTSIESVNKGQVEAGLAMGFTPFQSFRFFTLPIMIQRVFPVYIGEVIGLIKATSIVGYIAVEDLTKASDMIRSLTFDAFFSLIVITIIYFILIVLAINGLKSIQKITAPKRNKFCTV